MTVQRRQNTIIPGARSFPKWTQIILNDQIRIHLKAYCDFQEPKNQALYPKVDGIEMLPYLMSLII